MRAPRWRGVRRDGHHRLRGRPEQQIVEQRLVLPGDVGNLGWKREDDMESANRQEISLALGQPAARGGALALGAVPVAAAVIGDALMAAVLATLDMATERGGAAVADRRHHLELRQAQVTGVKRAEAVPGRMQNIRNLQESAHVSCPAPPSPR